LNGVYSYQTPDPCLFSYYWEENGTFLSDLPEVSDDIFLAQKAAAPAKLSFRVIVQTHGDYSELLGSGAKVGWFLTWYSDGMMGGTFLRGLLGSSECDPGPSVVELEGSVEAENARDSITISVSLVVIDPGSVSSAAMPSEQGLILERQSRTLLLSGATPELDVELNDFQLVEGLPPGIPYHIDLTGMPTDPEDMFETGSIRILINSEHPFASSLEGTGETAILSRSVVTQAFFEALLDSLVSSRTLDNTWPVGPVARGSIGMLWATILHKVLPEADLSDLRALKRNPEEYRKALLLASWTGGEGEA